jgi:ribonuclease HI
MAPPKAIQALLDSEWFSATTKETSCLSLTDSIGHNTNNVAELWGLMKGLQLAQEYGHHKLIVEGDSQIILSLFAKILNGVDPKNFPYWRLTTGLSVIATLIGLT